MYIYYNVNPKGKTIGDCVVRAISLALDIDYNVVENVLLENSYKNKCNVISRDCYGKVLEEQYGLPLFKPKNITVGELSRLFKEHKLIIRIEGHLTCSIYGNIMDIWNAENEIVDVFWVAN